MPVLLLGIRHWIIPRKAKPNKNPTWNHSRFTLQEKIRDGLVWGTVVRLLPFP